MTRSEAQKRATNKYLKNNYKQIAIRYPVDEEPKYKQLAQDHNLTKVILNHLDKIADSQTPIYIGRNTYEQLEEITQANGTTPETLITDAIQKYIQKHSNKE